MILVLLACSGPDSADSGKTDAPVVVEHAWGTVDTGAVEPFSRSILYVGVVADLATNEALLVYATSHEEAFPLVADCALETPAILEEMPAAAACPECVFTYKVTATGTGTRYGNRCGSFTDTFDLTDTSLDAEQRYFGYAPSYYIYSTYQTLTNVVFLGYTGASLQWVPAVYTTQEGYEVGGTTAGDDASHWWLHKIRSNSAYTYGY